MKQLTLSRCAVFAMVVLAAGCTMKNQDAPGVSGPSEFGTSVAIAIAPDILPQDGMSESRVTVTVRGPNGQPAANVALRADILVGGTRADFGRLSPRSLTTASDGRATLVYTAPPPPPIAIDSTTVDIEITPIGTDFNNSSNRFASLRVVPNGIVLPPDVLRPAFTATPDAPTANQLVLFDASSSGAPPNTPIAIYAWTYGDGRAGIGRTVTHQYSLPGTYAVRLTISDAAGRSAQTSRSITVNPGANPEAEFTFSPTEPAPNQSVNFNGVQSKPAPGRTIVSYMWDFGDGKPGAAGMQVARAFSPAGTYTVTLTVTDDAGGTHSKARQVTVAVPKP